MKEKIYRFHYQTIVRFSEMVQRHNFKLRCRPMECTFQKPQDITFCLYPSNTDIYHDKDAFGNEIEYGCIVEPHVSFIYQCSGIVRMNEYAIEEKNVPYIYRCPSGLTVFCKEMESLMSDKKGISTDEWVGRCTHKVYSKMKYRQGSTDNSTTAAQAMNLGSGVCQDYAHILIAICRNKGLAARYVSGFMTGTGETHAWVEVHNGEKWIGFDPTNDQRISYGYIKVAHGRDAADCPVNRGVFSGNAKQQMEIEVRVEKL